MKKIGVFEEATGEWGTLEEYRDDFLYGVDSPETVKNVYLKRNGADSTLKVEKGNGIEEHYESKNGGRWYKVSTQENFWRY